MTNKMINMTIDILGKPYSILCPETEIQSLQKAAEYLNKNINSIKDSGRVLGIEKIMLITALNITHRLLLLEEEKNKSSHSLQERISELFSKVDHALTSQLELAYPE